MHEYQHQPLRLPNRKRRNRDIWLGLIIIFLVLQPVSYLMFDRSNPPVRSEPDWPLASPEVKRLAVEACFDCHSNETRWPWYSALFPVSWLVWVDVDGGRAAGNFSEWDTHPLETDEIAEVLTSGRMPPDSYTIMHPDAKLTDAQKQILIDGLDQIAGRESGEDEREDEHESEDREDGHEDE
ncbi:MAG: heme-binding domain-containing protein [Anaerolineae bacterium]|nr:heme-binding domain-containing protein [Anaerolineae bacterium]